MLRLVWTPVSPVINLHPAHTAHTLAQSSPHPMGCSPRQEAGDAGGQREGGGGEYFVLISLSRQYAGGATSYVAVLSLAVMTPAVST